jgi:hypothetical protein
MVRSPVGRGIIPFGWSLLLRQSSFTSVHEGHVLSPGPRQCVHVRSAAWSLPLPGSLSAHTGRPLSAASVATLAGAIPARFADGPTSDGGVSARGSSVIIGCDRRVGFGRVTHGG